MMSSRIRAFPKSASRDSRIDAVVPFAVYSASKALSVLKSALALHAEDTGTRSIAMPTNLKKRLERPARKHLSIDQWPSAPNAPPYGASRNGATQAADQFPPIGIQ